MDRAECVSKIHEDCGNQRPTLEGHLNDPGPPRAPVPEPDDEKTPVSTCPSHFNVRARDADPPRPAAMRLRHLPVRPQTSSGYPRMNLLEPSVVVEPSDRTDDDADSQPETLFIARRRHARKLELALVAGISALLAGAAALFLAKVADDHRAADPSYSSPANPPAAAASTVYPANNY